MKPIVPMIIFASTTSENDDNDDEKETNMISSTMVQTNFD